MRRARIALFVLIVLSVSAGSAEQVQADPEPVKDESQPLERRGLLDSIRQDLVQLNLEKALAASRKA